MAEVVGNELRGEDRRRIERLMKVDALPSAEISSAPKSRAIALWLYLCFAMVFVMVVLGGMTRLTQSGLSIVEWQPLLGALPPLSDRGWADAFAKYQQFPEYRKLNEGMSLAEFKAIFWMEWTHRLWGRLIGVVFALPFAWFVIKGRLRGGLALQCSGILALGGLQGALGWYMVQSGLVDEPDVSPYRLAAHLGLAMIVLGWMLWLALGLDSPRSRRHETAQALWRWAAILAILIFLQALAGAFVAGLDAGLTFNTFPLMNGRLIPGGYFDLSPWWANAFENVAAVQFNHRLLGITILAVSVWLWWRARGGEHASEIRFAIHVVLAATLIQVTLGVLTLLYVVPIPLAILHQAGAMVLFAAALWAAHRLSGSAGNAR